MNAPATTDALFAEIDRLQAEIVKARADGYRQGVEQAALECESVSARGQLFDEPYYSNGADDCEKRIRALLHQPAAD